MTAILSCEAARKVFENLRCPQGSSFLRLRLENRIVELYEVLIFFNVEKMHLAY